MNSTPAGSNARLMTSRVACRGRAGAGFQLMDSYDPYSRDKRPDCPQVVIALVVTPDGLPLAYEVLPGNTADSKTLRMFLGKIEQQYGKARRVWVMDRGVPTEAVLAEMRSIRPRTTVLRAFPVCS
jgi:hypothetical protein